MSVARRALAAIVAIALAGCAGIGEHRVTSLRAPASAPRAPRSWEEVFARPTSLRVAAYQTGWVLTGPSVLIDASHPRTPEREKTDRWVPALAYRVTHPREGTILLDSGVGEAEADGSCDFGVSPFFHLPCRSAPGIDAASQLASEAIAPSALRFVLVSHLHGDHVGGLAALARRGPLTVALSPAEWAAGESRTRLLAGYIARQLRARFDVALLAMDRAIDMPLLGRSLDLFGDGSLWVVDTAGHTRGEISVLLNAQSGPLLLTFDAAHLAANVLHRVRPGFAVDDERATSAVERIAAFARAYPEVRVIFGHEPTQWMGLPRRVMLAEPRARGG